MSSKDACDTNPRLVLVGDVAVEFDDPGAMLEKIAPYFRQSAIAFCNCEWPLTDRGEPVPGKAGRVVRSAPDKVGLYEAGGFDVVSLANNHIMNYGAAGLAQTLEVLDKAGVAHCGAGMDLADSHRPAVIERDGLRVAFLAYTSVFAPGFEAAEDRPGMAVVRVEASYRVPKRLHEVPGMPMAVETVPDPGDTERMLEDIRAAHELADAVVVSFHWGISMGYQHLAGYQRELGHVAIDAGADLVVGHHPHTIQPVEIYKGRVIAYCPGHCGFDMESASFSYDSILIEVPLENGAFGKALVRPIGNSVRRPEILDLEQGRASLDWLARISGPLGTEWEVEGQAMRPIAGAAAAKD
jgi:poly-gamma-glutamate synthesis protein (capsule biosynthesis protein)